MKTARLVPLALLVLALFAIAPASASVILHVDAATKEVYFTGSDTGTAIESAGSDFYFQWDSGTGTDNSQIQLSAAALEVSSALGLYKYNLNIMTGETGRIQAFFAFPYDPGGPFTATGTGVRVSYATIDAPHQALLESFAGPLTSTTFSPMDIQHTSAVPEPSTYALLCISLGVVGFVRKKMMKAEG